MRPRICPRVSICLRPGARQGWPRLLWALGGPWPAQALTPKLRGTAGPILNQGVGSACLPARLP